MVGVVVVGGGGSCGIVLYSLQKLVPCWHTLIHANVL